MGENGRFCVLVATPTDINPKHRSPVRHSDLTTTSTNQVFLEENRLKTLGNVVKFTAMMMGSEDSFSMPGQFQSLSLQNHADADISMTENTASQTDPIVTVEYGLVFIIIEVFWSKASPHTPLIPLLNPLFPLTFHLNQSYPITSHQSSLKPLHNYNNFTLQD